MINLNQILLLWIIGVVFYSLFLRYLFGSDYFLSSPYFGVDLPRFMFSSSQSCRRLPETPPSRTGVCLRI